MNLIFILLSALSCLFSFGTITAQNATSTGYAALPVAVRDYYSKEVLFQAQPRCKFLQFAKIKRDLQAIRGKAIVFVRYSSLTGGGALAEDQVLTPQAMAASEIRIAVTEQGNAIQVSELLMRTSLLDVLGDASKLLARNVATVLDGQFRDACLTTTNVVYGNGAASASVMSDSNVFNSRTVKDVVQLLATNNAPRFENEYYVCIAHPYQLRQLRDDPNWINANTYMGRRQLYVGEVGMYEGVIFIETTQMPHLTAAELVTQYGSSGTMTAGCQAVVFGENAYAWAIALDVEMRDDGIVEFGRKHSLGWYGIWGTGLLEGNNVVTVLSATSVAA